MKFVQDIPQTLADQSWEVVNRHLSRIRVLEDAGHYLFEDKPEETCDRIYRFMTA